MYKQGQAGVTKATVSIVFNNSDKANGPVEYQHLDQITVTRQVCMALSPSLHLSQAYAGLLLSCYVTRLWRSDSLLAHDGQLTGIVAMQLVIGGRNKYLINGHVAQPT